MFRFLHSSDLHLGKPFGRHDEDVRGRLRQARHGAIARLAQAARASGADLVLLAGDTFDQETPAPSITRQALNAMGQEADIRWVLMPGNHDSIAASELWQTITRDKPPNVILALTPEPIDLNGAHLLPAPCTTRNPGRDLTIDMAQATPEGAIRLGLGHGGIHDFASLGSVAAEGPSGTITPDRAKLAGLDYLGLGDWHGQIKVTENTWYSGTPEADSFKHVSNGTALAVALAGAGQPPEVTPVKTGEILWQRNRVELTPQEDAAALIQSVLPALAERRDTLLNVIVGGRAGVQQMQQLQRVIAAVTPDFLNLTSDLDEVKLAHEAADLDAIDPSGGALRQAAEALSTQAQDGDLSAADRRIAATALSQLFSFVAEQP
ncbi:metallophosphoesterase family protein [Sulfitobacter donghicola]|uniref:Exonuclease n=1 Tax=Sulfitobacter donghicola DSW-25 = KCTC 12864 = JCM 14565 TaxID=1300350 RepID=A0A073IID0_9RHOB|nr:DNA repair exonuclease [Sulfitobacter donghicola]KEJ90073.1 exonuclease [Sulfitobacter donghicola DSW-25 = KCTC 12864 = JCM 14565]KIN66782.1 Exonuclease SbcD [Sulfitobacter donghicola DSW-25 = KCTC 12864 = JCM 14565]